MSKTTIMKCAAIAALFLGSAGFTSCDYFSDVTVPASDTTRPYLYYGVWDVDAGEYADLRVNNDHLVYEIDDPRDAPIAVAAATDRGGVQELEVVWIKSHGCLSADGEIGSIATPLVAPQVETQTGSVGDRVSNGIYLVNSIRPASIDCPGSMHLSWAQLEWTASARDFHGNRRQAGSGVIRWSE